MELPIITIRYLAILVLIYAALTATVTTLRFRLRVSFGDGGHKILNRAIRAHGNLSEYLPLAVLVIGALEVLGVNGMAIHLALGLLLAARLSHILSMFTMDRRSRRYFYLRVFGAGLTLSVITVSALLLSIVSF